MFALKHWLFFLLIIFLNACGVDNTRTHTQTFVPVSSPSKLPATLITATPSPTSSPKISFPTLTPEEALTATLKAVPASTALSEFIDLDLVQLNALNYAEVIQLENPIDEKSLWLVIPVIETWAPHVAIYENNGAWVEIDRIWSSEIFEVFRGFRIESKFQHQFGQDNIWLEFYGINGAHNSQFFVISFDGFRLRRLIAHTSAGVGAPNGLFDLDRDGIPEAVLDVSNYYVSCYACGVREFSFRIFWWDEDRFVEIELFQFGDEATSQAQILNDRAIDLASANLWKDAEELTREAILIDPDNKIISRNEIFIRFHAEVREWKADRTVYPLLEYLFYGDYDRVLDLFRPYSPEDLFAERPMLLSFELSDGTIIGEGITNVQKWFSKYSTQAISVKPDFAAAYFLRGWAAYILDNSDVEAITDISRAVELDPTESLYLESLEYISNLNLEK